MKKKYFVLGIVFSLLAACSNVDMPEGDMNERKEEVFNLQISYNGKQYDVPCALDKEDNLQYLDTEFKSLYDNELSKCENLVTFVYGENRIAYFRSTDEMYSQMGYKLIDMNETAESRALTDISGRVTLWDDTGYKDRSLTIDVDYLHYYACPHLKPAYGFNDKTSALKVWSYIPKNTTISVNGYQYNSNNLRIVFLGYEDDNYRGKVLCCIPENSGAPHEHPRLKDIGWNDKITAVVLSIAENGMYTPHE